MSARAPRARGAALVAAGLATAALLGGGACGGAAGPRDEPPAAGGSTLRATWIDPGGDGFLQRGRGRPMVQRTELGPRAPATGELARLAVFTDVHVRDEESPARPAVLDRAGGRFRSTFRPQEALSPQVFDAAVRAVDAERPGAALLLGDLIDNAQANELDQALAVLRGGRVRPDSGAPGYEGVQRADDPDPLFYRPDVDAPRHPGLVDAAQHPFRAAGLTAPWYATLGNHDALVQGEFARTARTEAMAVGDRRLVALEPALRRRLRGRSVTSRRIDRVLAGGLPGRTTRVSPDPGRRQLDAG
ncbi:MAG TPA: hypothetical protein VK279_05135, partial [Solirubrobacteraceae bacterium]|nr:hypothetical protein [Solirubrobacteraceae bacterium]